MPLLTNIIVGTLTRVAWRFYILLERCYECYFKDDVGLLTILNEDLSGHPLNMALPGLSKLE